MKENISGINENVREEFSANDQMRMKQHIKNI